MFSLLALIASALCMELSVAEYDNYDYYNETQDKFQFFISREKVANWTNAKIECRNIGLELVSLISQEEQNALNDIIFRRNKNFGYWLSGIRHNDGKYYWDSTGTEVDSSIQGWAWGEPNHAYGKEDCMELKFDRLYWGWNDHFCDEIKKYICQVPKQVKPETKLQKLLYQKKWQYKEDDAYDSTQSVQAKEIITSGIYDVAIDYDRVGLDQDHDYPTTNGINDE